MKLVMENWRGYLRENEVSPPDTLYHATAPTRLANIMRTGLGQGESKFHNYNFIPTDYWGDDREKELRITSKDESDTVISPSAISKLIFISPKIPRFELKGLSKYNIPIESIWKGETKTYNMNGENV